MVIHLSSGMLWLGGILTMIACIILGMGLPTTAAYIITAILGVPALVDMGVSPLAAHMFIFYFAIISFITPPVAISAYAASGVARTNAMKTGLMSFRLGLAGFIVPFVFLYETGILFQGSALKIALHSVTAILGVTALASCLIGWFFVPLVFWQRILFALSAVALIVPDPLYAVAGAIPLIFFFVLSRTRKSPK
jgi:TRAP-type uncharacterized transport system fused permease subunit